MSDLKPIGTCSNCGKLHKVGQTCYCTKCGEIYTTDHICDQIVRPLICSRCGKTNTARHICVPKSLQCPICGKSTVEIETCPGLFSHRKRVCPVCLQPFRRTKCARCGKIWIGCGCPHKHVCLPRIRCPVCGGLLGRCKCCLLQKIVSEKELVKYLDDGWVLKMQLQSGDVLLEKEMDVETIVDTVMEQAQKQIDVEVSKVDVEKVTETVMEQANKQIAEAITKEKQRLLKE
ncbi:MAG: hypothetical protein FWH37_00965 [Candidatus Bathyarchaeota archaeon]|nr:hypothetical protein [Candidatus Termiticorpusculum sp.]